jgi:hypothetical protein
MLFAFDIQQIRFEVFLSALSLVVTFYFWVIKARSEKPSLKIFQLWSFGSSPGRENAEQGTKTISVWPMESGGVLVANNSTLQNSIIKFDCYLKVADKWVKGTWGYQNQEKPPWNIAPQTTVALSPVCFFEVPKDFEMKDNAVFRIDFITISGKRFGHIFQYKTKEKQGTSEEFVD